MNLKNHVIRYQRIRRSIEKLLKDPIAERDAATICMAAHWASFHLISAVIDQCPIDEKYKHKNHRGVKFILRNIEEFHQCVTREVAEELLKIYNKIETNYMVRYQYSNASGYPDYEELMSLLNRVVEICKRITSELASRKIY
ncbi:MAG: hypothetical protein ACTSRA_07730 [Promethearchaeota archaeon]